MIGHFYVTSKIIPFIWLILCGEEVVGQEYIQWVSKTDSAVTQGIQD